MQSKVQAENFIRGAFLITLAQLASRVIGVAYRSIAQFFIGDKGLAIVSPPNSAYFVIASISAIGVNVAISRLVSERLAVEDYRGARRVFQVSVWLLLVSGFLFAALFAAGAPWLAAATGFPEAAPGFLVMAPAVLLVSLVCAFRGLYQGMQQMRPSALSQVFEALIRVGSGAILVAVLAPFALNWGAAGFNAGSTVGVLAAVLYGGWVYFREKPTASWNTVAPGVQSLEHESVPRLLGKILSIALPLALIGSILPLMQFIDSGMMTNRLMAIDVNEESAKLALAYLMNAGTLRDVPFILSSAMYVSLVPGVAESMATGRLDQAQYRTLTAFRLVFLVGIPATAGLLVGARDAYGVLYQGPGWTVMAPLAWSVIFFMVQQTAQGALQGAGLIWLSVRNQVIGILIKIVLTYWWTGLPALQAQGTAYATGVAFAVTAGLNLWALREKLDVRLRVREDIGRPALAAVFMGAAIWAASPLVHQAVHVTRIAGLIVIGFGGLVYLVAILALGGVTEADLGLIPGVRPSMIARLRRYRLLRDST